MSSNHEETSTPTTQHDITMEGFDSPSQNDRQDIYDGDDDGLFGSGSENEIRYAYIPYLEHMGSDQSLARTISRPRRKLDDVEPDSGDDEDRWDRRDSPMNEDEPEYSEALNIMDLNLGRTAEPETTDGQVCSYA